MPAQSSVATTAIDPARMRALFPLLARHPSLIYLDSAATAQKPESVLAAVRAYYETDNANVHRGLYDLARRATEHFESARSTIARFVNARDDSEIVFTRGTTESINLVAASWGGANLRPGDGIVLSVMEHHSNIVPWQLVAERTGARIRWVDIDAHARLDLDSLDAALSERPRIVALGHVSNAIGTIHKVAEVCARAHAAGALVLVDGAQGAPHLPIDVQELDCDFYALSAHKMGGPMGAGALWARRDLLDAMPPYQGGGEMIDEVGPERSTFAPPPHRFEAGTPNVAGAIGMVAAAEFLESVGWPALRAHEQSLVRHGIEVLEDVPGLRLFGPPGPAERCAVFSFTLDGVHPHDVATVLDDRNIAVRAGHHCAQPLMRRLGVPATTRASCFMHSSAGELDALADALRDAVRIFRV